MPPVDPSNGGLSNVSPAWIQSSERRRPRPRELRFLSKLGIPSWLTPLRDRSGLSSQPFWPVRGRSGPSLSRLIGVCRELSPPSSLFPPLSFFAFCGFPEWNTQDHPSPSLVCPWTLVRSWERLPFFSFSLLSLSLPLSFFLSLLSSPTFLGRPWMLWS